MRYWIDMHCDTLSELFLAEHGETVGKNHLCVDVERMRQTNMLAEFFACFVEIPDGEWDAGYKQVRQMIARMEADLLQIKKFGLLKSIRDLERAKQEKSSLALLTVEEGGILNGSLERLKELYQNGIRLITLTWNYENCIGYPNSRQPEIMQRGLKPFGKQVVEEMNEKGMIVDVSHLSDGGFWDCIQQSSKPVVASHSNARALCPHPRNLSDEMLHALGEKGGVAGMNFYPQFLKAGGSAEIADIVRHGMYILRNAGEDAVALGTDFDGFEAGQDWIRGIGEMEQIWEAFHQAGMTQRQLDKLQYQNVERVLREIL